MNIDEMSVDELNARFEAAFASVHKARIIEAEPLTIKRELLERARLRWLSKSNLFQIIAILVFFAFLPWALFVVFLAYIALFGTIADLI